MSQIVGLSGLEYTIETSNSFMRIVFSNNFEAKFLIANIIIRKINTANNVISATNYLIETPGAVYQLDFTKCTNILDKSDLDDFLTTVEAIVFEKSLAQKDYLLAIEEGNVTGREYFVIRGENDSVTTGTQENMWTVGGTYVPPTDERLHDIVSTSDQDVGTLLLEGTATGGAFNLLEDTAEDFIAGGVTYGDLIINVSKGAHGYSFLGFGNFVLGTTFVLITKLKSGAGANVLNVIEEIKFEEGDGYKIVRSSGTGASAVKLINQMDHRYFPFGDAPGGVSYFILNGTTGVTTNRVLMRCNKMEVVHAGSNKSNTGAITLTAQVDSTITQRIEINDSISRNAFFTTVGRTVAFLVDYTARLTKNTIGNARATISLYSQRDGFISSANTDGGSGQGNSAIIRLEEIQLNANGYPMHQQTYTGGIELPGKTDVWLVVSDVTAKCKVSANLTLIVAQLVE